MLFNSFTFLLFFPIAALFYYVLPHKLRGTYLLLVSYGFYMNWNPTYALLLAGITLVSYFSALGMSRLSRLENKESQSKKVLVASIVLCLLPLIVFKYFNFINGSVFALLQAFGMRIPMPDFKWLLPVGISFFTFKVISYLVDVYKGRIEPERNLGIYALYVSFFVDLAAGPIDRAEKLIPQLKTKHNFVPEQVVKGLRLMLWGYFMKVVVADRLTLYVDPVFNHLDSHSGISVLLAAVFFSIQIYCDFGGYSFIAIGCGKVMGFDLMTNFERPYMATSVTDFWRRWHISLSTWFRDYVYIPLGGNRCSKLRNRINLLVTFTVSGLWHGANWTFVIWGFLNGVFQVFGKMWKKSGSKQKVYKGSERAWNIFITFVLMTVAWTFFRANNVEDAIQALGMMCVPTGSLYIPQTSLLVYILMGMAVLLVCDVLQEMHGRHPLLENKSVVVRFASYLLLIVLILTVGVFDGGQFIYFQF